MRFAILGSGAVGGYFGARLWHAGHDVTFIARGAHLDTLREQGLDVRSPLGDVRATAAADLTPLSRSASMRLLRMAIMAISEAAKKPLAKIKARIKIASNQKLSRVIGGVSNWDLAFDLADEAQISVAMLANRPIFELWPRAWAGSEHGV